MLNVIDVSKCKDLIFEDFIGVPGISNFSKFKVIVVYEKPSDYPEHFVARLFDFAKPSNWILLKSSLKEIREAIPSSMVRFERDALRDDLCVVESYI